MIDFDTDKALRLEMTRNAIKSIHKQTSELQQQLKTGGPQKEPPVTLPTANPRRHDVVAWRQDGLRLDHTKHETKEAAMAYGKALPWIIYSQWALMDGRDMLEKHSIAIPEGMAIDDNGMPVKQ
jgi:hypothetical protein